MEEARDKRKSREAKGNFFMVVLQRIGFNIQDKPRFKKRVSNQDPSKLPKDSGDRVSNPKLKKGKGTSSPI